MGFASLFNVATEFRFEIGSAMLGTKTLTGQVEKLSSAANDVVVSFQKVGMGVLANLGIGPGGLLGLISESVSGYEHLQHAQLNFANTMTAMGDKLTGPIGTFNERMIFSKQLLEELALKAREFALPQGVMIQTAEQLMPALGAKGLLGNNMKNLVDFSRNMLKAAPAMGVDPQLAQQQSLQMLTGGASMAQTFFQRLTFDTEAMAKFKNNAEEFNKLKSHEKFNLMLKSLQQFTKDADVLSGRVDLISSQFSNIKDTLKGASGILIPIGQKINTMVVPILKKLDVYLQTFGREIIKNFVLFFDVTIGSLENMLLLALQLKEATRDVKRAGISLGFIAILQMIGGFSTLFAIWGKFGGTIKAFLGGSLAFVSRLGLISKGTAVLTFAFTKLLWPMALLVTLFQILSRGMAIAKLKDAEAIPIIMAKFSEQAARIGKAWQTITWPFRAMFNYLANLSSYIFRVSFGLDFLAMVTDKLVKVLELAADIMEPLESMWGIFKEGVVSLWNDILQAMSESTVGHIARWWGETGEIGKAWEKIKDSFMTGSEIIYGALTGAFYAFNQIMKNLMEGKFFSLSDGVGEAFQLGAEAAWDSWNKDEEGTDNKPVTENNTYIGKVTVKNNFKENMHPDRIAFTIIDQLGKVGRNKVRASGGTNLALASSVGVNQ